ncbi:hypothetical protein M513_00443 [Trichuris suis]|uniref:BHLH domain-containing protein n=1 Tax=Trichuris suis TaxID=68888 RepID=A0A085MNF4_9BILA|nr:hypothetical protein M513_00443 [Trichuris suis]
MQPLVNSGSSASDELVNEVDRRAHHNALERRRRHHIKDSFATLRAMLPTSMEPRASRASILNATASYIMTLNTIIAALKSENEKTEGHIRHIEVLFQQAEEGLPNALESLLAYINQHLDSNF